MKAKLSGAVGLGNDINKQTYEATAPIRKKIAEQVISNPKYSERVKKGASDYLKAQKGF